MRARMAAAQLILIAILVSSLTLLLSTSVQAQEKPTPPPSSSAQPAAVPDQAREIPDTNGKPVPNDSKTDNCFLPPLNELEMLTTGVVEFQIPARTQHEFDEACAALHAKKFADAEAHLRRAVKQDAKFLAAWVLLGQVLEVQQRMDEAHDACSKPASASYLPAYLCLADISSRAQNWDDVLRLSLLALEIDPSTAASAYVYNAAANYNLHNLPAAEKSALRAIDIDTGNGDPHIHFLLAQIYQAKGDRTGEAAQLREYLKYATDPSDVEMAKKALSGLE